MAPWTTQTTAPAHERVNRGGAARGGSHRQRHRFHGGGDVPHAMPRVNEPVGTPASIAAVPRRAAMRSVVPVTCTLTVRPCWPVMVEMSLPRTFQRTLVILEPQASSPDSPAALR